jgi:hypothetical protein
MRKEELMLGLSEVDLVFLYHGAIIFIFLLIAIVAIGGIIKIKPFDRMEPSYVKTFSSVLLIEVIAATLATYDALPTPGITRAEEYSFELKYIDYINDWINARNPEQQTWSYGDFWCMRNEWAAHPLL